MSARVSRPFLSWSVVVLACVLAASACGPPSKAERERRRAEKAAKAEQEAGLLSAEIAAANPEANPLATARKCEKVKQALTKKPFPADLEGKCSSAFLLVAEQAAAAPGQSVDGRRWDLWVDLACRYGADENRARATTQRAQPMAERKAKEEQKLAVANRRAYGERLRTTFLDSGLDIKVKVSGSKAERITFTYALFSDVWSHRFQK